MSESTSKAEWLYIRNGQTFGPLTTQQLRKLVTDQRIGPKDLVCRDGTDRWVPAGSIRGLFPASSTVSETVDEVEVRPSEADRPAVTDRDDLRWRAFGGKFVLFNLIACAIVGFIKPPPMHIAALNEALDDVRNIGADLEESIGRSTRELMQDLEEKKKELERDRDR